MADIVENPSNSVLDLLVEWNKHLESPTLYQNIQPEQPNRPTTLEIEP